MRKDVLLQDWCKKVRYCKQHEYYIRIGTYEVWNDGGYDVFTLADFWICGERVATEELGLIHNTEYIESIPANLKRKTKAFIEYFSACNAFKDNIQCIPDLVIV